MSCLDGLCWVAYRLFVTCSQEGTFSCILYSFCSGNDGILSTSPSILTGLQRSSQTFCGELTLFPCWRASPLCSHNPTFCSGLGEVRTCWNSLSRVFDWLRRGASRSTCGSSGPFASAFSTSAPLSWVYDGPLYGQYRSPVLRPPTGRDILTCAEQRDPAPPLLGSSSWGHGF